MISDTQFNELFPGCGDARRAVLLPLLVGAMVEHGVVTRPRAAVFCALVGHDTDDLRRVKRVGQLRQLAHFWRLRGLNGRADKLTTRGDSRDLARFDRITRAFGMAAGVECERRYLLALSVLTNQQFADYMTTSTGRGTARLPQGAAAGLENPHLDPEFRARLEAQIARGASGGVAVRDGAQAGGPVETSPEAKGAPETAAPGQADDTILDDILASETTKRAGAPRTRRLVGRLALVVAAAGAGNTKAIVGLVVAGLLVGALIYFERRALAQIARAVVRRRKGAGFVDSHS